MASFDDLTHRLPRRPAMPFLPAGAGAIAAYGCAMLGICCLLAVLCFHFPHWLTLPELRALYGEAFARQALQISLIATFVLGLVALLSGHRRRLALVGLTTGAAAVLWGGATIPVAAIPTTPISLGLDWFVLSLLASVALFVPLERVLAKDPAQPVLRPKWRTDLTYFFASHLLVQWVLIFGTTASSWLVGWTDPTGLQSWVAAVPWGVQLLLAIVVADLAQYAVHRTYHSVAWLWRFHAVHHSSEAMDWLAGSRIHLVETMVTRSAVLIPLMLLGVSPQAMNAYVIIVGVQAVLSHANLRVGAGWLRYVVVTPHYHHWHHSADPAYADKNFAIHLPVIDMIFGTFKVPPHQWPDSYGVIDEPLPGDILGQHLYPFRSRQPTAATAHDRHGLHNE